MAALGTSRQFVQQFAMATGTGTQIFRIGGNTTAICLDEKIKVKDRNGFTDEEINEILRFNGERATNVFGAKAVLNECLGAKK